MITFETKMVDDLDGNGQPMWQFRAVGKMWSRPLSLTRCMVEMKAAAMKPAEPKEWSKPLVVGTKRVKPQDTQAKTLYEIRGGKVQRIAASAAERNEQQIAEILKAMEGLAG